MTADDREPARGAALWDLRRLARALEGCPLDLLTRHRVDALAADVRRLAHALGWRDA